MKIYTKKGDKGETRLAGGELVSKADLRLEAYGTIDELNSFLGLTWDFDPRVAILQSTLFVIGSQLAQRRELKKKTEVLGLGDVTFLETWIDEVEAILPPLKNFILPGGSTMAIRFHLCRSVCRRAERRVVDLDQKEGVPAPIIKYLNRLSDLFFVLARFANLKEGLDDILWRSK